MINHKRKTMMKSKYVSYLLDKGTIATKNAIYYSMSNGEIKVMKKSLKKMSLKEYLGTLPLPKLKEIYQYAVRLATYRIQPINHVTPARSLVQEAYERPASRSDIISDMEVYNVLDTLAGECHPGDKVTEDIRKLAMAEFAKLGNQSDRTTKTAWLAIDSVQGSLDAVSAEEKK